ncbi:hypothetical protein O9X98_08935 [Agrobacterium salinitolerans]|nr:hypothetical protein [Agrobacterium salinitolerans]
MVADSRKSCENRNSVHMYDGCYVELRDGTIRGPLKMRADAEPHMRPWSNGNDAWLDHGGCHIEGGESPLDVVRVLPARHSGLELAIAIIEARLPLYSSDAPRTNALRDVIGDLRSAAEDEGDDDAVWEGIRIAEDRSGMVLRTLYIPKSLDQKLLDVGVYASRPSKSTALSDLVRAGLEVMLEGAKVPRYPEKVNDPLVFRSVWFTQELDSELRARAFRRSQQKGQLAIDLISSELDRQYCSPEVETTLGNDQKAVSTAVLPPRHVTDAEDILHDIRANDEALKGIEKAESIRTMYFKFGRTVPMIARSLALSEHQVQSIIEGDELRSHSNVPHKPKD